MSNLTAFLAMVAACEGADYHTLYGGKPFQSLDDHPRRLITAGGYTSTAAGRYQILARTWDDFCLARGKRAFDEAGQDACAIWLIARRKALDDVEAGRLDLAIQKCGQEWASLPGSPYHQPTRTLQYCIDKYIAAGGTISTQEPAPIDHHDVTPPTTVQAPMGASLLLSLLPSVLQLFAPRAQAAVEKVVTPTAPADVVTPLVQAVFSALLAATGKSDPVQAVAAVTDPAADKAKRDAIVAQVQDTALDYLDKLAPVLDKLATFEKQSWDAEESSRDAAAARVKPGEWDMAQTLVVGMFIGCAILLLFVCGIASFQVYLTENHSPTTEVWAAITGLIGTVFGIAVTVFAFRFGTSRSSGAKDVLLGEIAKGR